ncbi:hypothetical protein BAE44_0019395 [Dichanthelium oligosanthes]|uniref:Uncharacterized protein n=1 Tax=Dichanthelium oligosanthes TaxID=888268 RepID=A0A1E5V3F8_9POAL|nr:hypothetical protein BAE44_0019395 [Dichanthelium oligosanthes]
MLGQVKAKLKEATTQEEKNIIIKEVHTKEKNKVAVYILRVMRHKRNKHYIIYGFKFLMPEIPTTNCRLKDADIDRICADMCRFIQREMSHEQGMFYDPGRGRVPRSSQPTPKSHVKTNRMSCIVMVRGRNMNNSYVCVNYYVME